LDEASEEAINNRHKGSKGVALAIWQRLTREQAVIEINGRSAVVHYKRYKRSSAFSHMSQVMGAEMISIHKEDRSVALHVGKMLAVWQQRTRVGQLALESEQRAHCIWKGLRLSLFLWWWRCTAQHQVQANWAQDYWRIRMMSVALPSLRDATSITKQEAKVTRQGQSHWQKSVRKQAWVRWHEITKFASRSRLGAWLRGKEASVHSLAVWKKVHAADRLVARNNTKASAQVVGWWRWHRKVNGFAARGASALMTLAVQKLLSDWWTLTFLRNYARLEPWYRVQDEVRRRKVRYQFESWQLGLLESKRRRRQLSSTFDLVTDQHRRIYLQAWHSVVCSVALGSAAVLGRAFRNIRVTAHQRTVIWTLCRARHKQRLLQWKLYMATAAIVRCAFFLLGEICNKLLQVEQKQLVRKMLMQMYRRTKKAAAATAAARQHRASALMHKSLSAMRNFSVNSKQTMVAHLHLAQTLSMRTLGALRMNLSQSKARTHLAETNALRRLQRKFRRAFVAWAVDVHFQRKRRKRRAVGAAKLRRLTEEARRILTRTWFGEWQEVVRGVKVERWALGWWAQKAGAHALTRWRDARRRRQMHKISQFVRAMARQSRLQRGWARWQSAEY